MAKKTIAQLKERILKFEAQLKAMQEAFYVEVGKTVEQVLQKSDVTLEELRARVDEIRRKYF